MFRRGRLDELWPAVAVTMHCASAATLLRLCRALSYSSLKLLITASQFEKNVASRRRWYGLRPPTRVLSRIKPLRNFPDRIPDFFEEYGSSTDAMRSGRLRLARPLRRV